MGVGVYSSNFEGTGDTFIVSGPLLESQEDHDSFVEDLEEALHDIGADLGLGIVPTSPQCEWARFDRDRAFVLLSEGKFVDIGYRSWETDYIVGVAGASGWHRYMADPGGECEEIFSNTGRTPEHCKAIYDQLAGAVCDYVRLRLMHDGFECRYKTSGYTSSAYQAPEDVSPQLSALKQTVIDCATALQTHPALVLNQADTATRKGLTSFIEELGPHSAAYIAVPFYDSKRDSILFINPLAEEATAGCMVPENIRPLVVGLCSDNARFAPLPDAPELKTWFKERVERSFSISDRPPYALYMAAAEYERLSSEQIVNPDDWPEEDEGVEAAPRV